jgi:hypothetical protein
MTLKEWRQKMQIGTKVRCTWRFYWESKPETRPETGSELLTVQGVQTNGLWFLCDDRPGSQRTWMSMPKATGINFLANGFEIVHPDPQPAFLERYPGAVVSRYEYEPC